MAIFRRWTLPSGEKAGRWVSARTGRIVKNVTVAKQKGVPRSAIRGNEGTPRRWTEIEAVYRVKSGERGREKYIEAVRRITIHDATRREIRFAARRAREYVRSEVKKKGGTMKGRIVVGVEKRRRETRPTAGAAVEVREAGEMPEIMSKERREDYQDWWDALGPEGRREMAKYLPVETLAWLEGEQDEDDDQWEDANGRMHDTATGRFV